MFIHPVIKTTSELLEEWKNYLQNSFDVEAVVCTREIPPAEQGLDIDQGDFTREELTEGVNTLLSLKGCKAPGIDFSLTAKALKQGGQSLKNSS